MDETVKKVRQNSMLSVAGFSFHNIVLIH
jgi:hypothetical protein